MKRHLWRSDVLCEIEVKGMILISTEGRRALLGRIAGISNASQNVIDQLPWFCFKAILFVFNFPPHLQHGVESTQKDRFVPRETRRFKRKGRNTFWYDEDFCGGFVLPSFYYYSDVQKSYLIDPPKALGSPRICFENYWPEHPSPSHPSSFDVNFLSFTSEHPDSSGPSL